MFDKHIIQTQTNPVTRVIEKTITPDKVVEMYDKTREEALHNLVKTCVVKSSIIDSVVQILQDAPTNTRQIQAKIVLNGEEIIVQKTMPDMLTALSQEETIAFVINAFSEAVAKKIVLSAPTLHVILGKV